MIKIIPFKPGHFDFIDLKPVYSGDPDLEKRFETMYLSDGVRIITVVARGLPMAVIAGVVRHGTMDIMAGIGKDVKKIPLSFHRFCVKLLIAYQVRLKIRRMQFIVREDFTEGLKWAESLGFEKECLMRKSGPDGSNCFMYAKVF